ncbi:MAG: septum formation initiator family protein [Acidimicrobiales bacterium]
MIRRARLFFLLALLLAMVILVGNFPLGALVRERSTVRTESAQLAALQATNRTLSSQVRALHDPATVAQIAHEQYGLVAPGQRSVVVLPGAAGSSSSTPDPLANNPVPASDLLPSDAILDPGVQAAPSPAHGPGFWRRVLDTLEFWHSLS